MKQIFMGNANCKCTGSQIAEAYQLLAETLEIISGLQQMQSYPNDLRCVGETDKEMKVRQQSVDEDIDTAERRINENAKKLFTMLTGRKIKRRK